MARKRPSFREDAVVRFWLERQGLTKPRRTTRFTKRAFVDHLERTGALQLDTVNVLERAHYLTLWSRFGAYDRAKLDKWVYQDRAAYEYWGHEASILPISHLPVGRRRMRRFPPKSWQNRAWWKHYQTSTASKRRVLRRIREEGALESSHFERQPSDANLQIVGWTGSAPKEDKRTLKLLWHQGKLGISDRRHFRCVYDLAERVYPTGEVASATDYEDSWLLVALSGCGLAPESHLVNYMTAPELSAVKRKQVIARNLKKKQIVEVRVEGHPGAWYGLPHHLHRIDRAQEAEGTTLISPFDSLLWQRRRAKDLLDFEYKVEIYVPAAKRQFGYYVLPILHRGRLVGRLDPKLHRDRGQSGELEIKAIYLEAGVRRSKALDRGLRRALEDLAEFVGTAKITLPRGWGRLGR